MKSLYLAIWLFSYLRVIATPIDIDKLAKAIYNAEGGAKTKYPYGIKSIRVTSTEEARRVCVNTIRNNIKRWQQAGRRGHFIDFLADRYCPPGVDPKGNVNWKRNVRWFYAVK